MCTGRVDAYIKLWLDPSKLVQCADDKNERNVFLYPGEDLYIELGMNPEFGVVYKTTN